MSVWRPIYACITLRDYQYQFPIRNQLKCLQEMRSTRLYSKAITAVRNPANQYREGEYNELI
jgi:hypothetical protein